MPGGRKKDGKSAAQVREEFLNHLRQGDKIPAALEKVGRSRSWYEDSRRRNLQFKADADAVKEEVAAQVAGKVEREIGTFAEFSSEFLFTDVFPHSQNMVDVLEGRDPSWMHQSMVWEPGTRTHHRILINIPPNFAKTTTISTNYVVYKLMQNPNLRVMVISKTQDFARKILYAIKQRLMHPMYSKLQLTFGPVGGWKAAASEWSQTRIYLERDDGEKDPSVEALGIGGMVYGSRADLIILDDAITLSNAGEYTKQMDWIRQEVATRLGPGGQLLVVGTRVSPVDLYRELRNPDHYTDGEVPWSYLAMPAVLEYAEDPADWVSLWPRAEQPMSEAEEADEDGLYPRWTGERLAALRNEVGPTRWGMVYQQQDVSEDAVFPQMAVFGSVNKVRRVGPLNPGAPGHPDSTDGWVTVCGMDPAIAGTTAVVALAVHRESGRRLILDVQERTNPTPAMIRELIEEFTERYKPSKFVIETNAFQGFLSQDEGLLRFMANRGVALIPHVTHRNKLDPDMGIAAMAPLFGTVAQAQAGNAGMKHQDDNLMEIPDTRSAGPKSLVEQLCTWSPHVKKTRRRSDAVDALWFCVLHSNDYVTQGRTKKFQSFGNNKFLSTRDKERQVVINLADYENSAVGW